MQHGSQSATAPHASDSVSLDAIIRALYECISGPAGHKRDWGRYRSLFLPQGRMVIAIDTPGERPRSRFMTVDDFIARVDPIFATEDFWECESARSTDHIGNMAHVLSHYESRRSKDGRPFETGANSMQLFFDGERWWFVSIMWNTHRG